MKYNSITKSNVEKYDVSFVLSLNEYEQLERFMVLYSALNDLVVGDDSGSSPNESVGFLFNNVNDSFAGFIDSIRSSVK